ncbi:hypothetical protein ACFFWC_00570 [Plantactinospora siamensis]|uniref:Uncharacterized protein n=1 Tax=Plantactinospora siamensis TaxID=555372 RepID=A0ABV6NTN3_9ACTN
MQPEGPYSFTELVGRCQVGAVWSAEDEFGRLLTVAVLDATAAGDPGWRQAFEAAANTMAQPQTGDMPYVNADFAAQLPWVAYSVGRGPGAERLFQSLGMVLQPDADATPGPAGAPGTAAGSAGVPGTAAGSAGVPGTAAGSAGVPGTAAGSAGVPGGTPPPVVRATHPVSGSPGWGSPMSGPPAPAQSHQISGPPYPMSAPPVSGAPSSGAPLSPAPLSPAPAYPAPVSGRPAPVSGRPAPVSGRPAPVSVPPQPVSAEPGSGAGPFAGPGRRIAPVERPARGPRRRVWVQALVGVALLLAGGAIGFGWGNSQGRAAAKPDPSPSLPVYEATQFSINKAKFDGALAQLAEPWLAHMGGCAANTDSGGPDLPRDEERHVFCRYGGVSVHFALYDSPAKEDAARAYRAQLGLTGTALAPGLRPPTRTTGGVTGAPGSYVEYAFKTGDGRAMCGIWWDRDDSVGAFYLESLCESGLAGNWDALRDLWHRNS